MHLGVISFLGSLGLCDGNITVSLGLCNGSPLLDLGNVIDTEVFDDIVLVGEGLYVKGDHLQTHLLQVRDGVFLYTLTKSLTVGDHFFQLHLAHDLTHVAFKSILDPADDHILALVQEEL